MKLLSIFFSLSLLGLIGCPTPVVPTTSGLDGGITNDSAKSDNNDLDGAGADNCSLACLNLRKPDVHCAAGFSVDGGEDCTKSCRHARDSRLMPLDIPCATKARSLQEAHACKGWGC